MSIHLGKVFGTAFGITRKYKKLWLWQMMPSLAFIFLLPPIHFYYSAFKRYAVDIELAFPIEPETRIIFEIGNYLFVLSFFLLFTLAQIMTVYSANEIERGISTVSFIGILRNSFLYYFRILKLYFLFISTWIIIILAFRSILFSVFKISPENFYYFLPVSLLLLLAILISICAMQLTQTTIIIKNANISEAISHSWKLLLPNKWKAVSMMTILYFGSSLFFYLLFTPLFFVIPISFLFLTRLPSLDVILTIIFFIGLPLVIFLFMITIGIMMAFFQSTWTIFYLRINSPEIASETINE